jgi:hypothetical protein
MIVDHRTYKVKPGKLTEYLKLYETEGLPLQRKYLGHCVGWYFSNDIGPLSQVVHMWAYEDLPGACGSRRRDPAGRVHGPRRAASQRTPRLLLRSHRVHRGR